MYDMESVRLVVGIFLFLILVSVGFLCLWWSILKKRKQKVKLTYQSPKKRFERETKEWWVNHFNRMNSEYQENGCYIDPNGEMHQNAEQLLVVWEHLKEIKANNEVLLLKKGE